MAEVSSLICPAALITSATATLEFALQNDTYPMAPGVSMTKRSTASSEPSTNGGETPWKYMSFQYFSSSSGVAPSTGWEKVRRSGLESGRLTGCILLPSLQNSFLRLKIRARSSFFSDLPWPGATMTAIASSAAWDMAGRIRRHNNSRRMNNLERIRT